MDVTIVTIVTINNSYFTAHSGFKFCSYYAHGQPQFTEFTVHSTQLILRLSATAVLWISLSSPVCVRLQNSCTWEKATLGSQPYSLGSVHPIGHLPGPQVCNAIALDYIETVKALPCDDLVRFPNELSAILTRTTNA